ncbi:hypothetical protein [Methylibium sp.]|uniref:hypothetical protein n=1 Tax=Methylibium sp. TaxID=2067992 RepID=UPI0017B6AA91|nr:hypothetical protein [Methylibium sp.]MBA3590643.1 hypothetical protein [Methylibium sp.]
MRSGVGLLFLSMALCSGWAAVGEPAASERGRRLFDGELPLRSRVAGHTSPLPPQAGRCVNCHVAGSAGPTVSASAATRSFGPLITAEMLTQALARRGGPPSRYDEAALCRLLATGVDPADVIIASNMPRYEMSATDCHALWTYLIRPGR